MKITVIHTFTSIFGLALLMKLMAIIGTPLIIEEADEVESEYDRC